MSKTLTAGQIRTTVRIESKQSLNAAQRLALVSVSNNKENRAIAAHDVADVVAKTLRGDYQQKPEAAQLFIRAACGMEAPLFDALFRGFNGHKDQLPVMFAALSDPYAALSVGHAERIAKYIAAGDTPEKAEKNAGSVAALTKARTSKGADKVRTLCNVFIAKYGAAE